MIDGAANGSAQLRTLWSEVVKRSFLDICKEQLVAQANSVYLSTWWLK